MVLIGTLITNASRGTVNAWHFRFEWAFVVTAVGLSCAVALPAP
nr:DUF3265 domain-containing protein [Vibrio mimicus]